MATELPRLPATITKEAGKLVKRIALEEARRATGDGRMSGMGRAKLRAGTKTRKRGKSVTVEVRGVPVGAWAILEKGAAPHVIAPRTDFMAGSLRHPITKPVRHPGARSRLSWSKVVERANEDVPGLAVKLVREELS